MKKFLIVLFLITCQQCYSQIKITLRNSFIDSLKNDIIMDIGFIVDKAHDRPNTPAKDGDMHIAGRNKQVGMAVVAEIMNAKFEPEALDIVDQYEGTPGEVNLQGVWRIWCEHSGNQSFIQKGLPNKYNSTNPDHVFEIHPVTKIGSESVLGSLTHIKGFTYKTASDAFKRYDRTVCTILPEGERTLIITKGVGYNYVKFKMEIVNEELSTGEGKIYNAKVYTTRNSLLKESIRMVVVKDSPPARYLESNGTNGKITVVGIPRISLKGISDRLEEAANGNNDVLNENLPYEMIIVAVIDL
jgi:hypothetical protein